MTNCSKCGRKAKDGGLLSLSLFRLPLSSKPLLDTWLDFIGVEGFIPKPSHRLCHLHFREEYIEFSVSEGKLLRRLQPGAIPTEEAPPEKRRKRKKQYTPGPRPRGQVKKQKSKMDSLEDIEVICESPPTLAVEKEVAMNYATNDRAWMDVEFYSLLKDYLHKGIIPESIPTNRKNFLIQRAKHYKLKNGEIMYGDKIVIVEPNERNRIIGTVHVNPKTGVHSGARKVFDELQNHIYWRSMYSDIVKYIRACKECIEEVDLTRAKETPSVDKPGEQSFTLESTECASDVCLPGPSSVQIPVEGKLIQPTNTPILNVAIINHPTGIGDKPIWNLLELKLMRILGPNTNVCAPLLLSLADDVSRWMDVVSIPSVDIVQACVKFIISHCSVLGFAKFHIVGFLPEEQTEFTQLFLQSYADLTTKLWPYEIICNTEICPWVQEKMTSINIENIQIEVLKYRHEAQVELKGCSPSDKVLGRKMFLPEAPPKVFAPGIEELVLPTVEEMCADLDEQAVQAVQSHLAATKEQRSKRGSYQHLTMDMKRAITMYAGTHGSLKTAQHFSDKLGINVSASTIRCITKHFKEICAKVDKAPNNVCKTKEGIIIKVTKGQKLVIPKQYAVTVTQESSLTDPANESEAIVEDVNDTGATEKDKIGTDCTEEETVETGATQEVAIETNKEGPTPSKKPKRYGSILSPQMRAEVAQYALEHGHHEAVLYFKVNYDLDLIPNTVRAMKKRMENKKSHIEMLQEHLETLGGSPRGRPVKLGKHEDAVVKCLKELAERGEKMTSYMALTAAKTVITQREPEMLKENGGTIDLTIAWAKAFIKRLGLKNNA
ncbi:uncharacterized protein LOC132196677 [Neocloeon triangulifer]|uniref:uncharacterized protein LOC132196677 n=1 Tax=Neocloeon triangulifer TaxID=2078957 RepID=UPI00286EF4CC|nr:uncharacterized protein LOC132196677 [Neocloeon triangulifer]